MWEASRHDGEKKQSSVREMGSEQCMQSWAGEQRPGGGGGAGPGGRQRESVKGRGTGIRVPVRASLV